MRSKAPITQKLLNEFPSSSDVRNDEQSLGAQYIGVIGNNLEDLHEQLKDLGSNYYPGTADKKDIDVVYRVQLSLTKDFELSNSDPNNPIFIPPTVTGLHDSVWSPIIIASGNDIESFWYDQVPSRVDFQSFPITNTITDDASNIIYGGIATFIEANSPLITVSGIEIDQPKSKLLVEIVQGDSFLSINNQGLAQRGTVTLTGTTTKGQKDSETLIFIHNEIQRTNKEWSQIDRIDINNIETDQAKLRLMQHKFGRNHTPKIPAPTDFYNLAVSAGSKEDIDLFWDVNVSSSNIPILELLTWQVDDIKSRVGGLIDTQVIRSFELLDPNFQSISIPIDLAIEPFSHRIWIADSTNIYIYNNEQSLPNLRVLAKKNFDAMSIIEVDNYHITRNDSVNLSYIWRRPITDIIKHRVYVYAPDGTGFTIMNGTMIALDLNGSWIDGTPDGRNLRASDSFSLNQIGDWVWNMDVVYTNGAKENDQRIVSVDSKSAMTSFALGISGAVIEGLDFDSDQNLWVLINISGARSKLKVIPHYDVMLVDYDRKTLIFRESYDQVRIV